MLTQAEVYEVLRECYDPEIPGNIVDLGLVYGVTLEGGVVNVRMTLTAPGCSTADDIGENRGQAAGDSRVRWRQRRDRLGACLDAEPDKRNLRLPLGR
jgi:metal-sulfur cluster biosynthetic enzyme